ncbi:MAG TPA: DUF3810 domain-containing protein [Puia sp.]|nr:DUF3810 domain-containing protein [Puia sp.]
MPTRRKITWTVVIVLAVAIKVFSCFPYAVEHYYSKGIYPGIARVQRILFGWVPFSIGDLFYLGVILVVLYRLVGLIRALIRKKAQKGWFAALARRSVFALLWVYVLFNGLWGLNYDRLGIADQLRLTAKPYTTAELQELTSLLAGELNTLDSTGRLDRSGLSHMARLRSGAIACYDSLETADPRFGYRAASVKSSLFSYPGMFLGFAGYYNPFSGEAQVNTRNPLFTQPYTTCHEIAHQLGYAKENEANFVGFLAARKSPDPAFRYSVYLDLFLYAVRELYVRDSALARSFRDSLGPGVRADLREIQRFNRKYANSLEPMIWALYGKYLAANRQPNGIATYSQVTAWLIAYGRKNGWESLE